MDNQLREEITRLHAQICAGLADSNRIMILYALTECTCNVSDLARRVGLPQPTVSRHLKILRERGLVEARRDAQSVYYKVSDDRIIQALDMLRAVMTDRLTDRATLVRTARETLFS